MRLAVFFKQARLRRDKAFLSLKAELEAAGCELYEAVDALLPGTDMLLSVGGDGTFLSAATLVAGTDVPVLGVNLGRLGFLSEYSPGDIAGPLLRGDYTLEDRDLLEVRTDPDGLQPSKPFALNEISVHRSGAAMLGVDVSVDGEPLPTYWADGLLVATGSGSTAYALSVGGPICLPGAKVMILAPIAPHNLNLRPLIVPPGARIRISLRSRDRKVSCTLDNRNLLLDKDAAIEVSVARFSLKRVRFPKSNFIGALQEKLFWGEDVRNEAD